MKNDEWLKALKAGDDVIVDSSGWSSGELQRVERVTDTQIIVTGHASRFRRSDGYMIGSAGYHRPYLTEPTAELRDLIARARLSSRLRHIDWPKLSLDALKRIDAIVREEEK